MRWYHSLPLITMNYQLSSSTKLLVFLFCILIGLINILPCQSDSRLYDTCRTSFICGSINVTYPFWGDSRTRDCGYDQLELTCESEMAKINIANVTYRLLNYYPDTQVMQIARDDYASRGLCSPNYTNTTLDPALFELANGYINFSLVYGCPANPFPILLGNFDCPVSGTPYTNGYTTIGAFGPTVCYTSVVVPVEGLAIRNNSTGTRDLLQQGFEVRLKVDATSCQECTQSKGICGYDHSVNQTTCYCESGTSGSKTCPVPTTADGPQGQSTNGMYLSADAVLNFSKFAFYFSITHENMHHTPNHY